MIPLKEDPPLGHLYKDRPKSLEGLALQAEHRIRTIVQGELPTCLFTYQVPV